MVLSFFIFCFCFSFFLYSIFAVSGPQFPPRRCLTARSGAVLLTRVHNSHSKARVFKQWLTIGDGKRRT